MKAGERSPGDTAHTQQHISDRLQRSSITDFEAYYSITYYTSPKHIRSNEFGAHIAS